MKPTIWSASGSWSGKAPVPSRVQPTGMWARWESSLSSSSAPEMSTPRPERITGRLASLMIRAISRSLSGSGWGGGGKERIRTGASG